ncbi:hypothetical protein BH09BAC6_BH09BAC6_09650 [soil metagenome]
MEDTNIPKTSTVLASLMRADITTQWRNRRAFMMVLLVPAIILVTWKGLVTPFGGAFVLSNCITIGLVAIGLMGYTNSIARDRDKGIFQRLRVAPVPSWSIMVSMLLVQLGMIVLLTTVVFLVGFYYEDVKLSPLQYIFTYATAMVGGAVYLSLGQLIVGRIQNPESVNSTTRLVYFVFIMSGMFGELNLLGKQVHDFVLWSPYGTVKTILAAGMKPGGWNDDALMALLVTIGYTLIFAVLGIKWFKWNTK